MKATFIVFIFVLMEVFAPAALSRTLQSTVVSIDLATQANENHLIFLEDGSVGYLSPAQTEQLQALRSGTQQKTVFEFNLNDRHEIESFTVVSQPPAPPLMQRAPIYTDFEYTPTVLANDDAATAIFKELNPNARNRSMCYNRAHVWAYEEFNKRQLQSMKVFLFFTTRYIRNYNYGWWFHVSPYALVNENNQAERGQVERVLDYEFLKRPAAMKDWTDIFMQSKATCPTVQKYSDYSQHQEESDCYLIKTTMYFWQPRDIEGLENGSVIEKTSFIPSEISWSYQQGFFH